MKERLKTAMAFLQENQSFNINGLKLESTDQYISVTGWAEHYSIKNISKQKALNDMEEIKESFEQILKVSPELSDFVSNKKIRFNMAFNYGMGSILICYEYDGSIVWEMELRDEGAA